MRLTTPTLATLCAAILLIGLPALTLHAEDDPTFQVEMKDGVVTPNRIEVPAGRRIVIEITNSGTTPSEFESHELKRETGVFPGSKARFAIRSLTPGEHEIFDELHSDKPVAIIVAK
jgi:heme/copper-type cytochrome/quinol oxidase subunit 2